MNMKNKIIVGVIAIILLISGYSSADLKLVDEILDFINLGSSTSANAEIENEDGLYKVVKVVDGDTVSVEINGEKETLRLIGIDTPETVDPRKPVQCFGKEASNKAKELLSYKRIYLEADATQGDRDKYGRMLRYVILEDGTNFNEFMVREGYAHEYTYNTPYKYQEKFKEMERQAREAKKGLWAEDTCNGDTKKSAE